MTTSTGNSICQKNTNVKILPASARHTPRGKGYKFKEGSPAIQCQIFFQT